MKQFIIITLAMCGILLAYHGGKTIGKKAFNQCVIIAKQEVENKPFVDLVDYIKDHGSVFVISKNDAKFLVKESRR